MLQRGTALGVILALSLVLAACGGSDDEATGDEASPAPASTQAATVTPRVEPTAEEADDEASPTPAPADEGADDEAPATPAPADEAADDDVADDEAAATPEPTAAASDAAGEADSGTAIDVAAYLSERTMHLWDVYNTHDPDLLKELYAPEYWAEQEDAVRDNMRPFRTFGISIRGEETSPPTEIAPGKWEVRHTGHFPLGTIAMIFIWEEFDGEWLLTYAEDQ